MFAATKLVVAGAMVALFGGFLLSEALMTQRPREPAPGADAAVSPSMAADADPSRRPGGGTPPPCPPDWDPPERHILWETRSARLEADAIEMRYGDCFYSGVGPIVDLHSDPGDLDSRTLEVEWEEQGATPRFYVYFGADETHWWVKALATPTGEFLEDPSMRLQESQLFRTPRGESFEGDVHFEAIPGDPDRDISPRGELTITGLRLTAFTPGTGPGPLTDCTYVPKQRKAQIRGRLIRSGIQEMTPERAEALLRDVGYCFTFRYDYPMPPTPEGERRGYSERWCTAPPAGRVGSVGYLSNGEIVVFVGDREVRPERTQPPEGWNCPSDASGATASDEPVASPDHVDG